MKSSHLLITLVFVLTTVACSRFSKTLVRDRPPHGRYEEGVVEYFEANYTPQKHTTYTGDIEVMDSLGITYFYYPNEKLTIWVKAYNHHLKALVSNGLLHPELFHMTSVPYMGSDTIGIWNFEEIHYTYSRATAKRYSIWTSVETFLHPAAYHFEITTRWKDREKEFRDFIPNARLTYFSKLGIII